MTTTTVTVAGPQGIAGVTAYDLGFSFSGPFSLESLRFALPRACTFTAASCVAVASVAATAETVFTIRVGTTTAGTVTFAAGAATGTVAFDFEDVTLTLTLAAGDLLELRAPASADATLDGVAITLAGQVAP